MGWFPEYTITEDYALSMELKAAGFKGRYLPEYLAVGEAPDEIRDVMRQRSRWCKGHMQVRGREGLALGLGLLDPICIENKGMP